jgi:hypothetical protein
MYQPQAIKGYGQAFQKLGQQGFLGFYKGNMTQLIMTLINSSARSAAIGFVARQPFNETTNNALTLLVCSIIDIVTTPLMAIQSRLILQNRNPNFRSTYVHLHSI